MHPTLSVAVYNHDAVEDLSVDELGGGQKKHPLKGGQAYLAVQPEASKSVVISDEADD